MSTPSLSALFARFFDTRIAATLMARPGRVESYSSGLASVVPLGIDVVVERVPVMQLGSGVVRIKFDIRPGDWVLLVFADGAIDRWIETGRDDDPEDPRAHDVTDAIAFPGLQTGEVKEASVVLELTDSEIKAGGSSPLVTKAEFDAHTHLYNPGPGAPVATVVPTPIVGTKVLKGG